MAVTRILLSPVIALGVACLIGGNDECCGRRHRVCAMFELSTARKSRATKPFLSGAYRDRTDDLRLAKAALSQLS
jgi:hypothetical protein